MKKKVLRRISSTAMGALMFVCLPLSTFARTIDVSSQDGLLTIDLADETEDLILTGTNTIEGSVQLIAVPGTDKIVILRDLSLDTSGIEDENNFRPAFSLTGNGNVIIELDGTNVINSADDHAGIEKTSGVTLTIKDGNGTLGSLEATGGYSGAGIGGAYRIDSSFMAIYIDGGNNITIEGGTITAIGGKFGAGIGGGGFGTGNNITITNGTVTATSRGYGAGIGGGYNGAGNNITIEGGTVTATGGKCAAGIGGGVESDGSAITVSNDATIYAAGGVGESFRGEGAAIGEGGSSSELHNLSAEPVSGAEVLDISGLYETGSITTFAAGTTLEQITQGSVTGVTVYGVLPDPNAPAEQEQIKTEPQIPETPKKPEAPKKPEPPKMVIPEYTERSCIADVDVAALVAAALKADPNAKEVNIEFGDNICLTPDIMKDLFADNRVAKNCMFSHKGKRYVLRINAVDTKSKAYADGFAALKEEPDGLAGFLQMAKLFEALGVKATELDQ